MAGIGFELRRHLREETYLSTLRAYASAGLIGSGPWLVSIGSMLVIGMITRVLDRSAVVATQFFAAVTYLTSISLILAGGIQLTFVRFVADRLFEKRPDRVLPNLLGVLLLTTLGSAAVGTVLVAILFSGHGVVRVLLVAAFTTLSCVWVLTGLLSGNKAYRAVLVVFALGYGFTIGGAMVLQRFGLPGLLLSYIAGQGGMLFTMLALVARDYPSSTWVGDPRLPAPFVAFDFLEKKLIHTDLIWAGFMFNVAVWVDKYVFWLNPATSEPVLGPIRYSIVYDVPLSIAYLSVVPGMAVFLVRVETDFAEAYECFYTAVREGGTLAEIKRLRLALVYAARDGIHDILRIQGLAVAVLLLASEQVLRLFGIPAFFAYLLRVDLVATAFQVVLLGILTLLFYLDYRRVVLGLCVLFAASNLGLSLLSQVLGPRVFGMGFAVSAALTTVVALRVLSRKLDRLDYETFMR